MWYVIIILVVIGALYYGGKYALLHPKVNSALAIAIRAIALMQALVQHTGVSFIGLLFMILVVLDCIRDLMIADEYYEKFDVRIDTLFMIKSIASFLTGGWARALFFLFHNLYFNRYVKQDVDPLMRKNGMIPLNDQYWGSVRLSYARKHFHKQYMWNFKKYMQQKIEEGAVLSNLDVVEQESQKSQNKVEEACPKTMAGKLGELFDGEMKEKRKRAESEIEKFPKYSAFVDRAFYDYCQKTIVDVLKTKSRMSPEDILQLPELAQVTVLHKTPYPWDAMWAECFVVFLMAPLVADGTVIEYNNNDENLLEHHQYWHVEGEPILVRDASEDPALALDDD